MKSISKRDLFKEPFSSKLLLSLNRNTYSLKKRFNIINMNVFFNNEDQCYTDGWNITLGLNFPLFHEKKLTASEVISLMHGAVFHEMGHILYTPVSVLQTAKEAAYSGNFWPNNPDNWVSSIGDYISKDRKTAARSFSFYHNLCNIIEDGRIEYLLFTNLGRYNGFKIGLKLLRNIHEQKLDDIGDLLKKIDNVKDEEELIRYKYSLAFDVIFQLAVFGQMRGVGKEEYSHQLMKRVLRNSTYISDALDSITAEDLFDNINHIFCDLFEDILKPYFVLCDNDDDEQISGDGNSNYETSSSASSPLHDILQQSGMCPAPSPGKDTKAIETATAEAKADAAKNGGSAVNSIIDTDANTPVNATDDVEIERINTSSIWSGLTNDTVYTKQDKAEAKSIDIERINGLTTETEKKQNEIKSLNAKLAPPEGMNFGSAHDGIIWHINRIPDANESCRALYQNHRDIIVLGDAAAKKIKRFVIDDASMVPTASYSGKKFKPAKVYKPVPKYFEKIHREPGSPTCAIYIVGDQSGSMGGVRIEAVKATFLLLCEIAQRIKQFRFGAFGHHASGFSVYIDNYILPDENIAEAKYKIMHLYTSGCNRDGAALRYVADLLKDEQVDRKLLIMISDGQPNAGGYGGTAAEEDIQDAVAEYERFGIHTIAAAIGSDKEKIKTIYGAERFMDVTNLSELPDILSNIVIRVLTS